MSGDTPVVDVLGIHLERLVVVAGQLFDATLEGELVVIGGLAMVCRCTSAVRATDDVDAVSGPDGVAGVVRALGAGTLLSDEFPGAVGDGAVTVSVDGVPVEVTNEDTELRVGGVKLDVIPTLPLPPTPSTGSISKANSLWPPTGGLSSRPPRSLSARAALRPLSWLRLRPHWLP